MPCCLDSIHNYNSAMRDLCLTFFSPFHVMSFEVWLIISWSLKLKRLSSENNAKQCFDYERTLLDTIDLLTDFEFNFYLCNLTNFLSLAKNCEILTLRIVLRTKPQMIDSQLFDEFCRILIFAGKIPWKILKRKKSFIWLKLRWNSG